ncbi:hypothetical protein ElyMa_005818800 [Elysia marginata]|uniref:Uncharacterized protein n=1 Tax=Elysia marginata TaxID=1093978 RepID=A0AAV4FV10_9GAST|nr:hypothetical protein ElyMa_005818800 [Elysia marginata]
MLVVGTDKKLRFEVLSSAVVFSMRSEKPPDVVFVWRLARSDSIHCSNSSSIVFSSSSIYSTITTTTTSTTTTATSITRLPTAESCQCVQTYLPCVSQLTLCSSRDFRSMENKQTAQRRIYNNSDNNGRAAANSLSTSSAKATAAAAVCVVGLVVVVVERQPLHNISIYLFIVSGLVHRPPP